MTVAAGSTAATRDRDELSTPRRRWIVAIGWLVSVVCLYAFCVTAAAQYRGIRWSVFLSVQGVWTLAGAIAVYMIAMVVVGAAWYVLVRHPHDRAGIGVAVLIVLTSQFGKYLPGNVAQFGGKVALAKLHGFSAVRAVTSLAVEGALAVLAAITVGAAALALGGWAPIRTLPFNVGKPYAILFGVVAAMLVIVVGGVATWNRSVWAHWIDTVHDSVPAPASFAGAFGLFVLAHLLLAAVLQVVAHGLYGVGFAQFGWVVASTAAAWTLGFVTPGAPGGLGVREAMLASMLSSAVGGGTAIAVALAFRLVTTLGDVLGFVAGIVGQRLTARSACTIRSGAKSIRE